MAIDKVKFNAIYNQLKELVGEHGAFAIMVTKRGDGLSEDMRFETHGPLTALSGLMSIGNQYLGEALQQRLDSRLKPGTHQPD